MTPFELVSIVLLVTLILATLAFRSLKRIQGQSHEIELAMKALVVAHVKLLQVRAKRAGRNFPRADRLRSNGDVSDGNGRISSKKSRATPSRFSPSFF